MVWIRSRIWPQAVRQRGYSYFGVADHSQSAHYAGGLSLEEIAQQRASIERLNRDYGSSFRVFQGIESDILRDGSLDYPNDVLERFDFVIASVHTCSASTARARPSASFEPSPIPTRPSSGT
jgi:histidinol phosphatase-like PHP family hydrolase